MTLDLNKHESKLDDALNKETTESIKEWLDNKQSPFLEFCEMEDCSHCAYERQQEYEAELEKDACIDFAKWLAQSDWMSIWVTDKWMWECQLEDSKMGYKTEEELYQIYLKES